MVAWPQVGLGVKHLVWPSAVLSLELLNFSGLIFPCWYSLCDTAKGPASCFRRLMWEGLSVAQLAGKQTQLLACADSSSFLSITSELVKLTLFHFPHDTVMIFYWWSKGPAPTCACSSSKEEFSVPGPWGGQGGEVPSSFFTKQECMRTWCLSHEDKVVMEYFLERDNILFTPDR